MRENRGEKRREALGSRRKRDVRLKITWRVKVAARCVRFPLSRRGRERRKRRRGEGDTGCITP